jgi:hypothetical protein
MDLAALFILTLIGGYAFTALWRVTAYETKRAEGQHLYLRSALAGGVLFALAFVLRLLALIYWPDFRDGTDAALVAFIEPTLKDPHTSPQMYLVMAAIYSLPLGAVLALLLNATLPQRWAIVRGLSNMDQLLHEAQQMDMPVSITLSSGKVYVGLVVRISDPDRPPPSIVLFPMLSGRRDEAGRLNITTDYEAVYDSLDAAPERRESLGLSPTWEPNFYLVLRADQITSATMFSPAVYSEFNPGWREAMETSNSPPPRQEILVEIKQPPRRPWQR